MANPEDRRPDETQPLLASTSSSASAAGANKRRTVQHAVHHDIWATIVFFINLIVFSTIYYHVHRLAYGDFDGKVRVNQDEPMDRATDAAFIGLQAMNRGAGYFALMEAKEKGWLDQHAWTILIATMALVSTISMVGATTLLKVKTAAFIKVSLVLSVLLAFGIGIIGFVLPPRQYVWGTILVLISLAVLAKRKAVCNQIPLARWLIIETAANTRRYWGVIPVVVIAIAIISSLGLFFEKAHYLFYAVYWDKGHCRFNEDGFVECKSYKVIPSVAYALFTTSWVIAALGNATYVILARVLGSAYYIKASQRDASSSTTLKAIKYATVHSFGTISLAALVLTLLAGFYPLLLALQMFAFSQKWMWALYIFKHSSMILGILFRIVTYLILAHVALFNRSFKEGTQASRYLLRDRFWSAVVNYGLLMSSLGLLSCLIMTLTAGYAFLYVFVFKPSFYKDHEHDDKARSEILANLLIMASEIAALAAVLPGAIFASGAVSTYVAIGENPEFMFRQRPDQYAELRAHCPEVGRDIHGGVVGQ